jgi:hypothetical protein
LKIISPVVRNDVFVNKYDFELAHFNEDIDAGIEEYMRRIERFRDVIQHPKKKYFVYINEDYFYDEKYRQNDFNDNIFNEMLELENFIRNKYANIDYNILYFNFIHHNIPADSNIINIVLNSTKVYNDHKASPYEDFRNFCGKILSEDNRDRALFKIKAYSIISKILLYILIHALILL